MKWEYRRKLIIQNLTDAEIDVELTALGEEEWEVFAVLPVGETRTLCAYCKRPVIEREKKSKSKIVGTEKGFINYG